MTQDEIANWLTEQGFDSPDDRVFSKGNIGVYLRFDDIVVFDVKTYVALHREPYGGKNTIKNLQTAIVKGGVVIIPDEIRALAAEDERKIRALKKANSWLVEQGFEYDSAFLLSKGRIGIYLSGDGVEVYDKRTWTDAHVLYDEHVIENLQKTIVGILL